MEKPKRKLNFTREHKLPGRSYQITEAEKAAKLGISSSWLAKDRLKKTPDIDYARRGRSVRYCAEE